MLTKLIRSLISLVLEVLPGYNKSNCGIYFRPLQYVWVWLVTTRGICKNVHLTHWERVTHIFIGKLTTIDSDNGLSPERQQAIICTNAGILSIGPLGTNFSEILIEIHISSFKTMYLKMSSAKWRLFCPSLIVLKNLTGDLCATFCERYPRDLNGLCFWIRRNFGRCKVITIGHSPVNVSYCLPPEGLHSV